LLGGGAQEVGGRCEQDEPGAQQQRQGGGQEGAGQQQSTRLTARCDVVDQLTPIERSASREV
jgi:hypothetical protein